MKISSGFVRSLFLCFSCAMVILSCRPRVSPEESAIKEAWDQANAPGQFGIKSLSYKSLTEKGLLSGHLPIKPWSDDYWPLYKKNVAARYAGEPKKFNSFAEQMSDAKASDVNLLSPAEKYDYLVNNGDNSLTAESWDTFDFYTKKMGQESWGWMGICHGWAPAAYREEAPKNHVLARNAQGKQVLFFEGDLRGLMSKAYATNTSQSGEKSIGSRCDVLAEDIVTDNFGRPVDGAFTGSKKPFYIMTNSWSAWGVIGVLDQIGSTVSQYWLATPSTAARDEAQGGTFPVFVYDSKAKLNWDYYMRGLGTNAVRKDTITFYRSCRDLNPGSFHITLARYLSQYAATTPEGQRGFVIERTRTLQVWNQPTYGYVTQIGPLTPLSEDSRRTNAFRAPGTTHTAHVKTVVMYIGEDGPYTTNASLENMHPKVDFDALINTSAATDDFDTLVYTYTLEFDRRGWVIGGEWDETKGLADAPDFLWTIDSPITDRSHGRPSVIKYSAVKKLLTCANTGAPSENIKVMIKGSEETFQAVPCSL